MHGMWKPRKFKYSYLIATLYVFTLTLPSASAVYWAFGDELLNHSNAFSLLPKTRWRDAAVVLMPIHQFITFGFACTPLYFVWEKVIGMHDTKNICLRALARLPVVMPIWFLAIIFPFFGPISSAVGALLVSFTVYIIPALAHMLTYRKASFDDHCNYQNDMCSSLLTGLHACGDLSITMLRAFLESQQVQAVVSIGCCYNLQSEEEAGHDALCGFPISRGVKSVGLHLPRSACHLACQIIVLETGTVVEQGAHELWSQQNNTVDVLDVAIKFEHLI